MTIRKSGLKSFTCAIVMVLFATGVSADTNFCYWIGDGSLPGGRKASWLKMDCWNNYTVPDYDSNDIAVFGKYGGEYGKCWTVVFGDYLDFSAVDATLHELEITAGNFTFNLGPGLEGSGTSGSGDHLSPGSITTDLTLIGYAGENAELTVGGQCGACDLGTVYIGGSGYSSSDSGGYGKLTFTTPNTPTYQVPGNDNITGSIYIGSGTDNDGCLSIENGAVVSCYDDLKIGNGADNNGIVQVDKGSTLLLPYYDNNNLIVGSRGNGTLEITNGGIVQTDVSDGTSSDYNNVCIGSGEGSSGTLTISGAGSKLSAGDNRICVGNTSGDASGEINITDHGSMVSNGGSIYKLGKVTLSDSGSAWTICNGLGVDGELNVLDGAGVTNTSCAVDMSGTVNVDGTGSTWINSGSLCIGEWNKGSLQISNGGKINSASGVVADCAGSSGEVTVDGVGSTWTISNDLLVGQIGQGSLHISNGGKVSSVSGVISNYRYWSSGEVTVDGTGSSWTNSGDLHVGQSYQGSLQISNGGKVSSISGVLGDNADGSGEVIVEGTDSSWTNSGDLHIGQSGQGSLYISNGGKVSNATGVLGYSASSSGEVIVDGTNSTWINNGDLYIGQSGYGWLQIYNGGKVTANNVILGDSGSISFENEGVLTANGTLWLADLMLNGNGTINTRGLVSDLALVFDADHGVQQTYYHETGTVSFDEFGNPVIENAIVTLNFDLSGDQELGVGYNYNGSIEIRDGVEVTSSKGYIGYNSGSKGTVVMDSGYWTIATTLAVGGQVGNSQDQGIAEITMTNDAEIRIGQTLEWHNTALLSIDEHSSIIVGQGDGVGGSVFVGEDGLLKGNGEIDANLVLYKGTFEPGFSAGSIHITGDLIASEGLITLEIFGDGTADQLFVDGEIDIDDNIVELVFVDGMPEPFDYIDLIHGQISEPLSVIISGIDPSKVQVLFSSTGLSVAVPEPATLVGLIGLWLAGLFASVRHRKVR